jgi:CRP/FNR family transcriptional regulator
MRFERGQTVHGPTYDFSIIFALLEGRVRLHKLFHGDELTLEIIEPGHLFGDVPALAGRRRGVFAEALAHSRVALISFDVMRHLVAENPEVALRWAELLARRVYEYQQRMLDVTLKKVRARLASLILRLIEWEGVVSGEGLGIRTRYTHEQFATMIGAKRVAVSRAMSELRELGAVEVKGRRVYLKDENALRRTAEEAGRREAWG